MSHVSELSSSELLLSLHRVRHQQLTQSHTRPATHWIHCDEQDCSWLSLRETAVVTTQNISSKAVSLILTGKFIRYILLLHDGDQTVMLWDTKKQTINANSLWVQSTISVFRANIVKLVRELSRPHFELLSSLEVPRQTPPSFPGHFRF